MAHTKATTKVIDGNTTDVTPYCTEDGQTWPCDTVCDSLGIGPYSVMRPSRASGYATTPYETQRAGQVGQINPDPTRVY